MTDDDGKFDFIGIDEGSYTIDGEGRSGTAPGRPAHVTKGETTEVKLQLEPVHEVSAIVMTPNGAPASGAVVRVSADGGESWTLLFTDVEGRFEYSSPQRGPLQVIVMTQLYPALVAQLRQESSTPATLVLQPRGGKLRLRSRGYVGRGGTLASLNMYFLPGSPFGLYEGAAYLEPGVYTVCAEHVLDGRCRQVTINPLTEQTVDPRPTEEATP
jgi:hypothetical protein